MEVHILVPGSGGDSAICCLLVHDHLMMIDVDVRVVSGNSRVSTYLAACGLETPASESPRGSTSTSEVSSSASTLELHLLAPLQAALRR
jgi:hypothetical protein